jgi:hypothetical protein
MMHIMLETRRMLLSWHQSALCSIGTVSCKTTLYPDFNQDGRVPVFRIQHKKGGPSNDAVPFALVDPDELIITENKFIRIQNAFGYLSY